MTDHEINAIIAEACGWIKFFEPIGTEEGVGRWLWHKGNENRHSPPDYCYDLNAMAAAEETLCFEDNSRDRYHNQLMKVVSRDNNPMPASQCRGTHRATARQRNEAFIKTVCPEKWKE